MKVKIKKLHENAVIPSYAKHGDAGMDLISIGKKYENINDLYIEHSTGIAIQIPEGYVGLIFPRSSISNTDMTLANSVGVIDSSYTGEIKLRFKASCELADAREKYHNKAIRNAIVYEVGDKIGQLIIIPYPQIEFEEVDELSETERSDNGFGSTGR